MSGKDTRQICVIIPTYNEERIIGQVLEKTKTLVLDVIVVDDGSSDLTGKIAREKGAIVLEDKKNQGKGAALKRGFDYALKANYQTIITMDGDGQHNPDSIKGFIEARDKTCADIVIGNRMRNTENMPLMRIITNRFMSWIISHVSKQNIPDTQCGFRLIERKVLEEIKLLTSKYEMESEILIRAAKNNFRIESLPIETIYQGQKSQIHPILDTIRFVKIYIRLLFKK